MCVQVRILGRYGWMIWDEFDSWDGFIGQGKVVGVKGRS